MNSSQRNQNVLLKLQMNHACFFFFTHNDIDLSSQVADQLFLLMIFLICFCFLFFNRDMSIKKC